MAKNTQLTNAVVNAQADLLAALLDDGYLRIYDGTKPASADTALSGQTLLAELRFANPAAAAAVNGVITFAAIASATIAATGTATWFRCLADDGTTVVFDGSAGVSGDAPNLVLLSASLVAGAPITIISFTHSVLKAVTGY